MIRGVQFVPLLAAFLFFFGCSDEGSTTTRGSSSSSSSSSSGLGGSGGEGNQGGAGGNGGAGGQGGQGGSMSSHGPGAQDLVSSGEVSKSPSYKLTWTMGQSTQNQGKSSSAGYRLQGGLVGANGSVP